MGVHFIPRRSRLALGAVALGVCVSGAADAQQPLPPELQQQVQSCRPDAVRLCTGVLPGGGRIFACLKAKAPTALSPACRDALAKVSALQSRAKAADAPTR